MALAERSRRAHITVKMSHRSPRRSILGVFALLLGAHGSTALADAKVYHGSQCHPSQLTAAQAPTDLFRTAAADGDGVASGRIVSNGYFDCPIIRDVTRNTNGLAGARVMIVANEQQPGEAECILSSVSQQGAVLASQARATAVTATLDFGDSLNVSDALGYYHLFCRMPPSWTLARYAVDEYGSGNDDAIGKPSALDAKYYNAAEWCFPSERTAVKAGGYFGYPPDGYTTRTAVTCPIVRDDNSGEAGLQDFEVTFINPGASAVSCTLYSVSADGTSVESTTLMSSNQAGTVTLDYGEVLPLMQSSQRDGSYYFYCSFTDESRDWIVKGYRVVEKTVDD
jgi:hypothetical protein